jgi:hypothetical protein
MAVVEAAVAAAVNGMIADRSKLSPLAHDVQSS